MNGPSRRLAAIRVYSIVFAASSVLFGLYSGLVFGGLTRALLSGAIFGVTFSAIIGTAAVVAQHGRNGWISPRQELAIRLYAHVERVRECAVQVLGEVSSRPVKVNGEGGVEVRTTTSWRSWGEVLTVELRADGLVTDVKISSRPVVQLTLVDYGRGRDNVEAIAWGLDLRLLTYR
jgi:hypothetical protein